MIMASLINLFENITEGFVYRPILAAVIIGVMCAVIGVYVILRKMVFLVDGIAHTAFAGGALGLLLAVNPYITIGLFGTTTSIFVGAFSEKGKLSNDTAVGILFSAAMGLGIIFIGLMKSFTTSIASLLFGSVTTVSLSDLIFAIITLYYVHIHKSCEEGTRLYTWMNILPKPTHACPHYKLPIPHRCIVSYHGFYPDYRYNIITGNDSDTCCHGLSICLSD